MSQIKPDKPMFVADFNGEGLGDLKPSRIDRIAQNGNDGLHYLASKIKSDGSTADYYELPPDAKELQDIIAYKNMNAQIGEIFRACMRYGEVDHSPMLRDINKIIFYAQEEKKRLEKYGF